MTTKDKQITELKYEEALNYAIEQLANRLSSEKISLITFCKQHKLDYQVTLNLRTHPVKKYTTGLLKLLSALNSGKVKMHKVIAYTISDGFNDKPAKLSSSKKVTKKSLAQKVN